MLNAVSAAGRGNMPPMLHEQKSRSEPDKHSVALEPGEVKSTVLVIAMHAHRSHDLDLHTRADEFAANNRDMIAS